jgi:LPXTG-motif cell wall-anchored protein
MKLSKVLPAVCCVALLGAALAPRLSADEWDKKAVITFSDPIEIPGVHLKGFGVLPAGTYVFRLLDSQSDRHIVQIWNKDETTQYATILAIPDYRLKPTDKTVITFDERPAGEPLALRAWFSPGSTTGDEFVYPKSRAMALAKSSNSPVLFVDVEIPAEVDEPIKTPVVAMKTAPVKAAQPTGEEAEITAAPAPPLVPATLPSTGSNAPLIGLIGLIALTGAFLMRPATPCADIDTQNESK